MTHKRYSVDLRARLLAWPIRIQFLLLFSLLGLPTVGIIIYSGLVQRHEAIHSAADGCGNLAANIAFQQESLVLGAQQLASTMAQDDDVLSRKSSESRRLLAALLLQNPQLSDIVVTDPTGEAWATAPDFHGTISYSDRSFFRKAIRTGLFSSGEYGIGKASNNPMINFGYPLHDRYGKLAGVIGIGIDLGFAGRMFNAADLPGDATYCVQDHRGVILGRGPAGELSRSLIGRHDYSPDLFDKMKAGREKGDFVGRGNDGKIRQYAYRKLSLPGEAEPFLYIRVGVPVSTVTAQANTAILRNLLLLLPFLVIGTASARWIANRGIADRIVALERVAKALAKGDGPPQGDVPAGGGEIGSLARSIDDMAAALDSRERSLRESGEQLRDLLSHRSKIVEDERRRIARCIHDDLGQRMTVLSLSLYEMKMSLPQDAASISTRLQEMADIVKGTHGSLQRIIRELRPQVLDDMGLMPAIEWLAGNCSKTSGISISVDLPDNVEIDNDVATTLFRICQEGLANVLRHSGATRAWIRVRRSRNRLLLRVADNGRGVSPDSPGGRQGFGLMGIRERALRLGGRAGVRPRRRGGTELFAWVQLKIQGSGEENR
ncbi:MAG TPA: cache domain-containing protein [Candidatus Deferrimicrobiaceae bacterium]|jgi:signal transduction histidine kinase